MPRWPYKHPSPKGTSFIEAEERRKAEDRKRQLEELVRQDYEKYPYVPAIAVKTTSNGTLAKVNVAKSISVSGEGIVKVEDVRHTEGSDEVFIKPVVNNGKVYFKIEDAKHHAEMSDLPPHIFKEHVTSMTAEYLSERRAQEAKQKLLAEYDFDEEDKTADIQADVQLI